jgi:hypothetical protein
MKINKNIAISDTGFLFNPSNGESFSVNPVGAEIINLLKEDKSLEDISSYMVSAYDTDETTVEKDLYDFISILKNYSLINGDEKK